MSKQYITCREDQVRRIRIKCRCGKVSTAEVPQPLARGYLLHPCPGCRVFYQVHQTQEGKWEILRTERRVDEAAYELGKANERPERPERPKRPEIQMTHPDVGKFVKIVDITKQNPAYGNPHPEHIGKQGVITSMRMIEGHASPVITLSDGAVVGGWECWWEHIETRTGGN